MSKIYGYPVVFPGTGEGGGRDGMSAYEIALEQGFTGDVAAWLESLRGEKGETGAQGDKGDPGAQGPQGERGYTGRSAAYNLLDNSDFRNPVNQRGQAVYSFDNGYTIDRWRLHWTGDGELKVNDGYITLYRPIHSAYVFQNIPLEKKLIGKTVTVAAKVRGYGSLSYNFNGAYMDECFSLTDWKVIAYSFTVPNYNYEATDVYGVGLITQLDKHLDCEWIALYEGEYTSETLPEYHPKGYAHELLECQRYYRVFDSECIGNGYTTGAGNGAIMCLPFTMRMATPTVMCSDLVCRVNGADYPCNAVEVQTINGLSMRLVCGSVAGAPAKHAASFYAQSTFALSADL